jgi:hypothetical protein
MHSGQASAGGLGLPGAVVVGTPRIKTDGFAPAYDNGLDAFARFRVPPIPASPDAQDIVCPSVVDVYIFTFDEIDLCEAASECLRKLQRCAPAIRLWAPSYALAWTSAVAKFADRPASSCDCVPGLHFRVAPRGRRTRAAATQVVDEYSDIDASDLCQESWLSVEKNRSQRKKILRWGIAALPLSVLVGVILGAGLGAAVANIGVGVAIGAGFGVGIGVAVTVAVFVFQSSE